MILFLDLETTGLDPQTDRVLEVAAILTDDRFVEVVRWTRVATFDPKSTLANPVDPEVVKMHTVSGLWPVVFESTMTISTIDQHLATWLELATARRAGQKDAGDAIYLAGNSVHFDRAFMAVHMPLTLKLLHYRQIDVTSLNEMAKRFWPKVYEDRPAPGEKHRALADAEESLATARYYAERLGIPDGVKIEPTSVDRPLQVGDRVHTSLGDGVIVPPVSPIGYNVHIVGHGGVYWYGASALKRIDS